MKREHQFFSDEPSTDLFEGLNEAQYEAVMTTEGPLLVLAGAGSGKTRVVTLRIANLLQKGVDSSHILGMTFTNKAAGEMQERVRSLTLSDVLISTFHSLGARILRESIETLGYEKNFTIYDEDDAIKLIKKCLIDFGAKDKAANGKAMKQLISKAKNSLITPDKVNPKDYNDELSIYFPRVYERYEKHLKGCNAVDFDDLLLLPVRLFSEHPEVLEHYQNRWRYLLIDEYQDTNAAQYMIIKLLVAKSHNLCVVGDPDQSIYSWRGADIHNILSFEEDYPEAKVVRLEQNYRSRANILEASNAVIENNSGRLSKNLWSDLGRGESIKHFIAHADREEPAFVAGKIRDYYFNHNVPFKEMVVFYRTNAQSRLFEDFFLMHRIPYVIVGGLSFYQRREIKDILAYLRVVTSPSDYIAFMRTLNIPKRGIGNATIDKLRTASLQEGLPILSYCEALLDGDNLENRVKLTSRQKSGIESYITVIRQLRRIAKECSIEELIKEAITLSGYNLYIMQDKETADDRRANLDQLTAKAQEWELSTQNPGLESFLEELSLRTTLDETDVPEDRVSLMTIHNGKGLEFQLVFLVGLEEDLFPHINSRDNTSALEEERRLCYVGMTRAKEFLYLTEARERYLWGTLRRQRSSRFIQEIPSQYLERERTSIGRTVRAVEPDPFIDDIDQTLNDKEEKKSFSPGDAVMHRQFGVGVIRDVYEGSMGLTYTVHFSNDNQERTLIAKFAPLKSLD